MNSYSMRVVSLVTEQKSAMIECCVHAEEVDGEQKEANNKYLAEGRERLNTYSRRAITMLRRLKMRVTKTVSLAVGMLEVIESC